MSKENKTKSWPEVIAKARQIEDPEERLNYLIEHQPYLPLRPTLTANTRIVLPQYWQWWTEQGSEKFYDFLCEGDKHYTTVEKAVKKGIGPEKIIVGLYIANPSMLDSDIYGCSNRYSDMRKVKDTIKWITEKL